jgi:hypothetical protein
MRRPSMAFTIKWSVTEAAPLPTPKLLPQTGKAFRSIVLLDFICNETSPGADGSSGKTNSPCLSNSVGYPLAICTPFPTSLRYLECAKRRRRFRKRASLAERLRRIVQKERHRAIRLRPDIGALGPRCVEVSPNRTSAGPATTTAVGSEGTVRLPLALDAVIWNRSVLPTSAATADRPRRSRPLWPCNSRRRCRSGSIAT